MNAGFSNLDTLKKHLLPSTLKSDVRFDKVILALGLGVAGQFANATLRKFARVAGDTEVFPADHCEFILSRVPLESVSQAELKLSEADGWIVQDAAFIRAINLTDGIINIGERDAGPYYAQVRFTFTGGYWWETLEPDDDAYPSAMPSGATAIPDDLFQAWLLQCRTVWQAMDKLGTDVLASGASGQFVTGTISTLGLIPLVKQTLTDFIRYKLV